jgi:membrane protein DedA with SNARE-associated domain
MCIWGGIVGAVGFLFLSQAFGSANFDPMTLIPLGMLVVFYVVIMLAFKYESKQSKADLQSLFEAEIIEE